MAVTNISETTGIILDKRVTGRGSGGTVPIHTTTAGLGRRLLLAAPHRYMAHKNRLFSTKSSLKSFVSKLLVCIKQTKAAVKLRWVMPVTDRTLTTLSSAHQHILTSNQSLQKSRWTIKQPGSRFVFSCNILDVAPSRCPLCTHPEIQFVPGWLQHNFYKICPSHISVRCS